MVHDQDDLVFPLQLPIRFPQVSYFLAPLKVAQISCEDEISRTQSVLFLSDDISTLDSVDLSQENYLHKSKNGVSG